MASSGNFCTFNPLSNQEGNGAIGSASDDLSNGNTKFNVTNASSGMATTIATPPSGGKWYCEFYLSGSVGNYAYVGYYPVAETPETKKQWVPSGNVTWTDSGIVSVHSMGRYFYTDNQYTDSGATSFTAGDVISIALDLDNGATYFAKNGTYMNSGNPASGSSKTGAAPVEGAYSKEYLLAVGSAGSSGHAWTINAGQDSTFGGAVSAGGNADGNGFGDFKYSPPSGFLALCSANLPISDDIDPAQTDDDYPSKQFNIVTYTGNDTARSITGLGLAPDVVWVKARNHSSAHQIYDSSRGGSKQLYPNSSGAEATYSYLVQSFDSDGFSIGPYDNDMNFNGRNYIAWCWRANGGVTSSNSDGSITSTVQANQAGGFSIVTYTGTGSAGTFGHGLGAVPKWVMIKNRSSVKNWACYHVDSNNGGKKSMILNSNNSGDNSQYWNNTQPTSSVFPIRTETEVNESSSNFVAYCWAEVEGYSKFGSFEGNSNADGPFIYTGFRPKLLFIKNIDSSSAWGVYDGERPGFNDCDLGAWDEQTAFDNNIGTYPLDILSNGFKLRTSNSTVNSSHTWIYGAWGDVPFKYNNTF
ncbi:hypothetical protein [uncultured Mediterranean phage uvMED]|nr:hypothetical protein [uncultured Mediterranean phage uvMED]